MFYGQLDKQGFIIDERFNGGGFIPDFFMNILRQKLVNLWKPRYGQDWRTPGTAFMGQVWPDSLIRSCGSEVTGSEL